MIGAARRSVEIANSYFQVLTPEQITVLQTDASAFENGGPDMEVNPMKMVPVVITAAMVMVLLVSISLSQQVVATLMMIESPFPITIVEPKLRAYTEEPNVEKQALNASSGEILVDVKNAMPVDVELTLVHPMLITRKLRSTMRHLHAVGGFTSRWRGLPLYLIYLALQSLVAHIVLSVLIPLVPGGFQWSILAPFVASIISSLVMCRVHMAWIHSVIVAPKSGGHKNVFTRCMHRLGVARKMSTGKALLLPTLVYAVACQVTAYVPYAILDLLAVPSPNQLQFVTDTGELDFSGAARYLLTLALAPLSALLLAIAVVLPAAVALTRIEAAFLPVEEETIVPFDRTAIIGEVDLTLRGGATALFTRAWYSVDRETVGRLVWIYVKIGVAQAWIAFFGVLMLFAEVIGLADPESIELLVKSGSAQIQLAMLEAVEAQRRVAALSTAQ